MRREMSRGQRARGGIGLVADGPDGTGRGYSKRYGYRRRAGGQEYFSQYYFRFIPILLSLYHHLNIIITNIIFIHHKSPYTKNEFSLRTIAK